MKLNANKKLFIVWGEQTELSRQLAQGLSAELRQIYYKKIGPYNLPAFFRYILQAAETLLVLFYEKPAIVITQNPPVFAPLTALIYCKIFGAKLAIDSHTAAFLDRKWQRFYPLFRFAACCAALNSCHNYKNLEILKDWKIEPAMVMQFANPVYETEKLSLPLAEARLEEKLKQSQLPVMMVNRFAADDDWETVIRTAGLMPEADFFITGRPSGEIQAPANVYLTGYLKHEEFLKLMSRCRVALAFSLRPDTVLWSIREIMALNKPFVTTDSEVLRHYYGEVGLFAKSDADEIKNKILEAARAENEIKNKIKIFLEKDRVRWYNEIEKFNNFLT